MIDLRLKSAKSTVWYGKYTDFECPEGHKVVRVVGENEYIAVEILPLIDEVFEEYFAETPFDQPNNGKTKEEMELETALGTVLNKDPLSRHAGKMLKQIFEEKDTYWVNWCLENMQNKFIRDKVKLIKESGLYE